MIAQTHHKIVYIYLFMTFYLIFVKKILFIKIFFHIQNLKSRHFFIKEGAIISVAPHRLMAHQLCIWFELFGLIPFNYLIVSVKFSVSNKLLTITYSKQMDIIPNHKIKTFRKSLKICREWS